MRANVLIFLFVVMPFSSIAGQQNLFDRFDKLDRTRWLAWNSAAIGSQVSSVQGKLQMLMAPGTNRNLGLGLQSSFYLDGDFDLQAEFALVAWPKEQHRLGITVWDTNSAVTVERNHDADPYAGDCYATNLYNGTRYVRTNDISGKLRLVRTGTSCSGYYWSQNSWVLIGSGGGPTGPTFVRLQLWESPWRSTASFAKVTLDNFDAKAIRITPILSGSGIPRIGNTVVLNLGAIFDAGMPYQLASSRGTGPIAIDTRELGLAPDSLFWVSLSNFLPTVLQGYSGVLSAQGKATAGIAIPQCSNLIGLSIHTAFVTLVGSAPSCIQTISNTYSFTISR